MSGSDVTLNYLANEDIQNQNSKALSYNVVRFLPDINNIEIDQPLGSRLLVNPEYDSNHISSKFYQLPGSHTPQSCAINAAIIDANARSKTEKDKSKSSAPVLQPGLSFSIIEGYFNDNLDMVEKNGPKSGLSKTSGITSKFTSIMDCTNGIIPARHTIHYFTVKHIGYFYPNETGTWQFSLNSDDSSLMWLGDKAINNYNMNNLTVDARYLHGMRTGVGSMYLMKETLYPIRIYFGENGGGNDFIFGFKAPSGKDYGYTGSGYTGSPGGLLYTNGNNFSTPMVNPGTFFSIVNQNSDTTKPPNFGCYIYGKKTKDNMVQGFNKASIESDFEFMRQNLSDVAVVPAWSLIDSTSGGGLSLLANNPNTTAIKLERGVLKMNGNPITQMVDSGTGPYQATIQDDGKFVIKDRSNKVVWALQQISSNDDYGDTPDGTQRISTEVFNQIVSSANPNNIWSNSGAPNTMTEGQGLSYKGKVGGTYPFLVSANGKFKIDMDETCNLNLKISMTITPDTLEFTTGLSKQPTKYFYTDANEPYMYLNMVSGDSKILNTYSYLQEDAKASIVDPKANILNYNTTNFTEYKGYYPSSIGSGKTVTEDGPAQCQTNCKMDKSCMYYYTYMDNGKQMCYYNTDNTPVTFAVDPTSTGTNMNPNNSTLYVKNPDIKVSNYFGNSKVVKSKTTNDYKTGLPKPASSDPSPLNDMNMLVNQDYEQQYVDYVSYLSNKQLSYPLYVTDKSSDTSTNTKFGCDTFVGVMEEMESPLQEGYSSTENCRKTQEEIARNNEAQARAQAEAQARADAQAQAQAQGQGKSSKKSNIIYNFDRIKDAQNTSPPGFSPANPIIDDPDNVQSVNFKPTALFGKGGYKDNSRSLTQYKNPSPPEPFLQFFSSKQSLSYKAFGNIYTHKGLAYEFPNAVQPVNWNEKRLVLTTDSQFQKIQNPDPRLSFASIEGGIQFPQKPVVGVGRSPGITFSFWFRSDFTPLWARIFDFGTTLYAGTRLCCCLFPDGLLFHNVYESTLVNSTPNVRGGNDGQWHHVYWSISNDGEPWNIYIDNVKQTVAFPRTGIPQEKLTTCLFGASLWFVPHGDPFFTGAISDFKIYDCVLEHNLVDKYYKATKGKYANLIEGFQVIEGFDLPSTAIEYRYIPMDNNGFQFGKSAILPGYSIRENGSSSFNGNMATMYKQNLGQAPIPEFIVSSNTPSNAKNKLSGSVEFDGQHFVDVTESVQITTAGTTIYLSFACTQANATIAGHIFTCFLGNSIVMGAVVQNSKVWVIINNQYYNTGVLIEIGDTKWNNFIWVVNPDGTTNISINDSPLINIKYVNKIAPATLKMYLGANHTWYHTKRWSNLPNMMANGNYESQNPGSTYNQIKEWNQIGKVRSGPSGRGNPWNFPGGFWYYSVLQNGITPTNSVIQQTMFIPPASCGLGYWHAERPGFGPVTYTLKVQSNATGQIIHTYDFASIQAIQKNKANKTITYLNSNGWSNVNVPINVTEAGYYTVTFETTQKSGDNGLGLAAMILVTFDSSLYRGYINNLHIFNTALSNEHINMMMGNKKHDFVMKGDHIVDGFTSYEPFSSKPSIVEGMNENPGDPSKPVLPSLNPAVISPVESVKGKQLKDTTIRYAKPPAKYSQGYTSKAFSANGNQQYEKYQMNTGILGTVASEYGSQRHDIIQNLRNGDALGIGTLAQDVKSMKQTMGDNRYQDEETRFANTVPSSSDRRTISTTSPALSSYKTDANKKYQYGDIFDKDEILNGSDTLSVAKNDTRELILQENTIHSIGLITCATLLITGIMLARN